MNIVMVYFHNIATFFLKRAIIFIVHMLFCTIVTLFILYFNKKSNKTVIINNDKRIPTYDIMKAICILLMIFGHYGNINSNCRNIIYSFHMITFIVINGYFYKKRNSFKEHLLKETKSLIIPYLIFSIIAISIKKLSIIDCILGISYSKNIFNNFNSVGPVYFLLLLFVINVIYMIGDYFINKKYIYISVIILIGFILSRLGLWLPWSIDVAMYCLLYYVIGILIHKYNIFNIISNRLYLYFIFSCLWAYMIYIGFMEIAVRNYGDMFFTAIGSISGMFLLYYVSDYITKTNALKLVNIVLSFIGKYTLYILIIHTLLNVYINGYLQNYFDIRYMYLVILSIIIQITIGSMIGLIVNKTKIILSSYRGIQNS